MTDQTNAQSLYGMNFFTFDSHTMKIVVAEDLWIYIATWLPLTLLTLLGYAVVVLLVQRPERRWRGQVSMAEMIKRYE